MIKEKVSSVLESLKDNMQDYAIIIKIKAFSTDLNLVHLLRNYIHILKKKSKACYVQQVCKPSYLEVKVDKALSKINLIKEFKYITLLKLECVVSNKFIKTFEKEKFIQKMGKEISEVGVDAEVGHGIFIIKDFDKSKLDMIDNPNKKTKTFKQRVWDFLWLKYGVDDVLSEEQIDKIVSTTDKAKKEVCWIEPDDYSERINTMLFIIKSIRKWM
jgi:hypothetical protein